MREREGVRIRGSVAVVSGAGRGIGRATAQALAGEGAVLALMDRLEGPLRETARELGRAGAKVLALPADITRVADVEAAAGRIESELGPVELLVNNAGTLSYVGPLWEADPERWLGDVRVNLYGTFLMCRSFVGAMVRRARGRVINIVSMGGVGDPHPWLTSYASSKAGLMRMTEGLAKEVEDRGIKVFALAPPAVRTDMTRFLVEDPGARTWRPGFRQIIDEGAVAPERVARCVVQLAGGSADALSGRFIRVTEDLEGLAARAEAIIAADALTLRIRE
jgi:NAD(P)-dependent dehydrogenase (short-subunit alcohol dehydrogenase family)